MCYWWYLVNFVQKYFFGLFQFIDFLQIFPIFFELPQKINVPTLWNTENVKEKHVHLCISLVLSKKTPTLKNCAYLAPLPLPDIQPNIIDFAHNFLRNLDLPPKFILPTLGNTDYLKDIHDNLYLSLIWCRKTSTHIRIKYQSVC